ncbi:malto-oligosyltrehalose trehalohydrolase [Dyadobacter sp. CY326]|uniref:malto-oligosyltrehalose trehalohydrolase n=1 Tax=Dyadobacter sp. CY326 TaxID=2907300 RepID=UPI001F2924CE|nr:malto-oligosyltrehalose trehalohydrolase [Dyadobacter sp. CY326]MCE7068496.1 malto-oligosyltrehalose trehalohydrolase [Dyadobacter sp. CY326]
MIIEDQMPVPGVRFNESGRASVAVWAPEAEQVKLVLQKDQSRIPLEKGNLGFWTLQTDALKPGDLYEFTVKEELLPDPATLSQPQGVHGPSCAYNLNQFAWTDNSWANHSLKDYIIYELHTGTFTADGTFASMEEKLDYLVDLGVNAIEIMPVSQFAGPGNWGYDGVFPYCVQDSYGGPKALQQLVNACHEKGLAVILDVVYNHIGPEGNVLSQYGPYFTEKYNTPWGNAINFDDAWCDGVRQYFSENVLMWFRDFHIDALRMDAVHAIKDMSPVHILQEMRMKVDALLAETGKKHFLIVEMDLNDTRFIKPLTEGGYGMDGQWIDEFHHALRVSSGQEKSGYYSDFEPITSLAKSYKDAYVFDGLYSDHRKRKFGVKADGRPGEQFVVFSQNHDHVGNRMLGERTSQLVSFEMQKLLAGAVFVSPYLPMLFMGEEYSEPNPFMYFVSHTDPELAEAVRKGRKREFAAFHLEGEAPDPMSEETFGNSKLQWELVDLGPHQVMLQYYKKLIALRKQESTLHNADREAIAVEADEANETIVVRRWSNKQEVVAILNFAKSDREFTLPEGQNAWRKLIASSDALWNGAGNVPDSVANNAISVPAESFALFTNSGS